MQKVCGRQGVPCLSISYDLIQAADQGDAEAQFSVGSLYMKHSRYSDGMQWILKSAEQGYGAAQYCLAKLHAVVIPGVFQQDLVKASMWCERAAKEASRRRSSRWAADTAAAREWLAVVRRRSARSSWPPARAACPRTMSWGVSTRALQKTKALPRTTRRLLHLEKAAAEGHLLAQFNLAQHYRLAASFDPVKTLDLIRASRGGLADAQDALARSYDHGMVPPDRFKAVRWFSKAAQGGLARSREELVKKAREGDGEARVILQAYSFCAL